MQRVLVLRRRLLAANANRWRVLHVHLDAGDGSEFRAQLLDDLIGRELAFAARLEDQVERAGVGRRARPATTNRGHEGLNIRVFGDDGSDGPLILDHGGEGGVLRAFGGGGDLAAVAAGQEVLGNPVEEQAGQHNGGDETAKYPTRVAHGAAQGFFVACQQRFETAFKQPENAAVRLRFGMAQVAAA